MSINLIGDDIKLLRARYDEALVLNGIPCKYQFPILPDSNVQGEALIDSYSEPIDTHIFFESTPKVKTLKRFGWVVANDDNLPFLIHCSWNLPHCQKDALFRIAGQYAELPERIFRVIEITYDLQAPDHIVVQVQPCLPSADGYHLTGYTDKEVQKKFNKSNHFLKQDAGYTGEYHSVKTDVE